MVGDRVRRRIVGRGSGDGVFVVVVALGAGIDVGKGSLNAGDAVALVCDNEGTMDCICVAVGAAALGSNVGVAVAVRVSLVGKLGETVLDVVVVGLKVGDVGGGALWGRREGSCCSTGVVGILLAAAMVMAAVGEPVLMFMLIIL